MRSKKALKSLITSLALQIVTMLCGFIVPRMIIASYGSAVNGTITSITQFLSYIVLLEAGVGGVVKAALYPSLSKGNLFKTSSVVNATDRFFKRLSLVFLAYMLAVACLFPFLVNYDFDWLYTFLLVLIIGISSFAQYYFGITSSILLQADQKRYVTSRVQTAAVILNTIATVILIKTGCSIHIVKLVSSLIFIMRPIVLNLYVRKRYQLIKSTPPDNEAINQRWDGLGHHIAHFLHTNTDVIVLTVFAKFSTAVSIAEVSVYGVYYAVAAGVQKLVSTLSSGLEAAFGDMIANDEHDTLERNFNIFEFISFLITTSAFTGAALLVLPFVSVYTKGVTDVSYIRPIFAYTLIAAEAMYCVRIPYNSVTLAAGHFRQTRNGAFAEAGINIVLSVILVIFFGITGVAAATFIAMTFRTVQYVRYLSRSILARSSAIFFRRLAVNIAACAISIAAVTALPSFGITGYFSWAIYAAVVLTVCTVIVSLINIIFYREDFKNLIRLLNTLRKER